MKDTCKQAIFRKDTRRARRVEDPLRAGDQQERELEFFNTIPHAPNNQMTKGGRKYKKMTMDGIDLIPLELNLHKYDLVIISQIINMIEKDGFWYHKTFKSVLSDLRNMWREGICELENASMYCTNNAKSNAQMD